MEAEQNAEQQLEQVRRNIEEWRHTRTKLGAMPPPLWDEAAAVARAAGTHRVSRALGLNYIVLKQRAFPKARAEVGRPRRPSRTPKLVTARFVEVTPPSVASESVVVEVVAASGAHLTLRLNGGAVSPDFAALIASFR